jgi:hypothetical protein
MPLTCLTVVEPLPSRTAPAIFTPSDLASALGWNRVISYTSFAHEDILVGMAGLCPF